MKNCTLRKLTPEDLDELTELYKSVEINKTNYLEKFSHSEKSFEHTGGMFLINDRERNKELLSSENDVFIGGIYNDELVGIIWYNLKDFSYPFDDIAYLDNAKQYKDIIEAERKNNSIFAGKEIIVSPHSKGPLSHILFRALLEAAAESGTKYKTGEVYLVNGYKDESGYHELNFLNIPSFKTLKKTGGIQIGTAPRKIIKKESIEYFITPQVFLWDIEDSLRIINNLINEEIGD